MSSAGRCYYYQGHQIPWCWESVIYGPEHCSCDDPVKVKLTVFPSGYLVFGGMA